MSTLRMVVHVEKTLKTTIQKKLRKSQKFARKISVAEFRYSQTIFLRFTVTLFHSNLDEKITSNEQKVTSNEQKVTSNEQRATSKKFNLLQILLSKVPNFVGYLQVNMLKSYYFNIIRIKCFN